MASPEPLTSETSVIALLEAQEKLLSIPPVDLNDVEDFRVAFANCEAVVRASSHFEVAFKTAIVLHAERSKETHVTVKCQNDGYFQYEIVSTTHNGFMYPRVRLTSMLAARLNQSNDRDERSVPTFTSDVDGASAGEGNLLDDALKNVFGYTSFKPQQRETIAATLSGKNVLSVLSTGGGKSLTFMLPSAISSKPTVVISPIRSLIEDLYDRATNLGLRSCRFLGGMETQDIEAQINNFQAFRLLFTTPEMLQERLLETVVSHDKDGNLERIVFDEAHTISTWGSTFRPVYKEVADKMAALNAPKLLLSATVSYRIQSELKAVFGRDSWEIVSQSVYRDNLTIEVQKKTGKFYQQIQEFIDKHQNECGIIYCVLPNDVAKIHAELRKREMSCAKYHGQISDEAKNRNFQSWMNGDTPVMVANASFGMGIDKADVRYVVHAYLPTSIEEYYQQCGRAGRDGLLSTCQLFYSYTDKTALYKLFSRDQQDATQQYKAVNELIVLLENPVQCRHKLIMNYFGENREEFRCLTNCDNCVNRNHYSTDGTGDALKIVQTLVELGNSNCSCNMLRLVLLGSRQKKVLSSNFDGLTNFSCLKKVFVPPSLLDTFLHILINDDILGEKVESGTTLSVRVTLGQKAYLLLSLDTSCIKFVKS